MLRICVMCVPRNGQEACEYLMNNCELLWMVHVNVESLFICLGTVLVSVLYLLLGSSLLEQSKLTNSKQGF